VLGELYEAALAGAVHAEVEHSDGTRMPLAVDQWIDAAPGDKSLVDRCHGPTLDVGSGPGRLTIALAERGVPALGIDVTPYAVRMAQSSGALAMLRDVFGRVPGAGRWMTVLLADGNIGIGGDPAALLQRVSQLLTPGGQALVEVQPPGVPLRIERVRLRREDEDENSASAWFPWAYVGADQIGEIAEHGGLVLRETWTANGRWFAALGCERADVSPAEAAEADGAPAGEDLDAEALALPLALPEQAGAPEAPGPDDPEPGGELAAAPAGGQYFLEPVGYDPVPVPIPIPVRVPASAS
jgi:SAM-dependent methyltransferase